jgi:hypothetical protein
VSSFVCRSCQTTHRESPLCLGPDAPASWEAIPEPERASRGRLTDDLCEIDNQHFFVRGRLEVPIRDSDQVFAWLLWSSLSQESYGRTRALWSTAGREREPGYFGWLNSRLPGYPDTLNLKLLVHTRPVGERPSLELEPTEHPLSVEQREGITWERVHQLVHLSHGGA